MLSVDSAVVVCIFYCQGSCVSFGYGREMRPPGTDRGGQPGLSMLNVSMNTPQPVARPEMWGLFWERNVQHCHCFSGLVRPGLKCHFPSFLAIPPHSWIFPLIPGHFPSFLDFPPHPNPAFTAVKGCGSVNSDTCMNEAVAPLRINLSPG